MVSCELWFIQNVDVDVRVLTPQRQGQQHEEYREEARGEPRVDERNRRLEDALVGP